MNRDICTWRDLLDWCREKLEHKNKYLKSSKYMDGYEDAMHAVMSKISDIEHKEAENKARREREDGLSNAVLNSL